MNSTREPSAGRASDALGPEELRALDRDLVSWGDTVHYQASPLLVETSKDDLIVDMDGRVYIDTGMWHSSCNFGYRNEAIASKVVDQLDRLPQVNGDFLHREKLLLAREVTDAIYQRTGVRGRVSFNVGGALAVEDALKIARKKTKKNRVAVMMGGYHGRSLGTLNLSSSHRYREYYNDFPERAVMFPFANCSQCYYEMRREGCDLYCSQMIRKAFSNEFYGLASSRDTEIGAVVLETCQGRGYTIPPRDFFVDFLSDIKERGILIIDDEIQVGMYRTGKLFGFEHFGFVPDIITMSKSLTNGLSPLSMVWARADLLDPKVFTPGHAHSNFASQPLGTAAALATWRYMMSRDYETSVPAKGAYFLERLHALKQRHPFVYSVDGLGLLLNLTLADRDGRPYQDAAQRAVTIAQDHDASWAGDHFRMVLQPGGYSLNVLKFAPYLDITEPEIDRMVGVLDQVMARLGAELSRAR